MALMTCIQGNHRTLLVDSLDVDLFKGMKTFDSNGLKSKKEADSASHVQWTLSVIGDAV